MSEPSSRVLIFGYGNPARGDDGLGPALVSSLEEKGLPSRITLDSNYQLTVEDSWAIAQHDVVVFVDADIATESPFYFVCVEPTSEISFSSHSVRAEVVLGMAESLFGHSVRGYLLGIRGYEFEVFDEELTEGASKNLHAAVDFIESVLQSGDFEGNLCGSGPEENQKQRTCEGQV